MLNSLIKDTFESLQKQKITFQTHQAECRAKVEEHVDHFVKQQKEFAYKMIDLNLNFVSQLTEKTEEQVLTHFPVLKSPLTRIKDTVNQTFGRESHGYAKSQTEGQSTSIDSQSHASPHSNTETIENGNDANPSVPSSSLSPILDTLLETAVDTVGIIADIVGEQNKSQSKSEVQSEQDGIVDPPHSVVDSEPTSSVEEETTIDLESSSLPPST